MPNSVNPTHNPQAPNDPFSRAPAEVALTVRDLVLQTSTQIQAMRDDFAQFKTTVVTKAELDLFRETQKSARRWAIGIICSIVGASSSGVMVVLAFT